MDAAIKTLATILHSRVAPSTSMEILQALEKMRHAPGSRPDHVFQLVEPTLSMYRAKPPAVTPFALGVSRVILESSPWKLGRMKLSLGRQIRGFEEDRRRKIINTIIRCKSTMDAEFLFGEAVANELVQTRSLIFGEVAIENPRKTLQELHHEAIGEEHRLKSEMELAAPVALVREPKGIIWATGKAPHTFDDEWAAQGTLFVPFDANRESHRLNETGGLERFLAETKPRVTPHTLSHLIHWMMEPWPPGTRLAGLGLTDKPTRCLSVDDAHLVLVQWADREEDGKWDELYDISSLCLIVELPNKSVKSISYSHPGKVTIGEAVLPASEGDSKILW